MSNAIPDWHATRGPNENHVVLFYDDEGFLERRVAAFLAEGLSAGESVVVIATPDHRETFLRELERSSIDVGAATKEERLILLDAEELLTAFMDQDVPDPFRFREVVGGVLESVDRRRPKSRVRAYGEMVDLLCRGGRAEAAVMLEALWNELANKYNFSLFCSYVMDRLGAEHDTTVHARILAAHSHVLPRADLARDRLRTIAEQQHRQNQLQAHTGEPSDAFRMLVEAVQDYAIFMLDPRGVVATWNAGAERIKGYSAKEIVGRHFSAFYSEADVKSGKCERGLETAAREGRFEDQGWRIRKDGSRFWANVILNPLRDPQGKLIGFVKVTRDLTERRQAEEERLRLARAEEANRVKDEFLATVSHELRTPLNAILGWGTVLQSRITTPEEARGIAAIVRNAQAQVRLIDDLLDVARIMNGKLRLEVGLLDFGIIAAEAVEALRPAAVERGVTLEFNRPDHPLTMFGDAMRLKQVIWNLLSNAVKFTDRGGSVFVGVIDEKGTIRLTVRDTGRGIEPDFLPYVFERFRQEEGGSVRRSGGLGLGLAIVRHLVVLHRGKVGVESRGRNQGTTFTVIIPVSVAVSEGMALDEPRSAEEKDATRLDGVSVLVVEDEADSRDVLEMVLQDLGAEVHSVGSAREARAEMETRKFDVIVSDIGMPGEDGYELVRSIRRLGRDRGGAVPMVALTGHASPHERRRALDAGFNNHVTKPVHPQELASVIKNVARLAR